MKKIILIFSFLFASWSSLFAVYEISGYECQGYYDFDGAYVEFYWKQGTTWYKIGNDDFLAFKAISTDEDCFFFGHEEDKVTVSSSSVPCSSEVNSCWVFRDNNLNNYNMYRAYIPNNYSATIDMGLNSNYSAITAARLQNSIEETIYTPPPFYIATYRVTSMWDFNDNDDYWNPADADWELVTKLKNIDKKIRTLVYPTGYVYTWEDTGGLSAYNYFTVSITKSSSKSSSKEMPVLKEFENENEKEESSIDVNLDYAQTISEFNIEGLIQIVLKSAFVKDDIEPVTVIKINSSNTGLISAIVFEKIDPAVKHESTWLIEDQKIVALNGIKLSEFKNTEEILSYIMANEIYSFSTLDNMNLLTFEMK
ncbi:MAG TPA: hypothetical protein PLW37_10455 [bacterium]|nr:hypothetical protein [bacterium]